MPDRIIRDELMESHRWCSLKDNADRLVFLAMILRADDFGNLECSLWHIQSMGLFFGIHSPQHAAQCLENLVGSRLVHLYHFQHEEDEEPKQYAHIPNFRQRLRFPKSAHPMPDWQAKEYKPDITASAWRDKVRPSILKRDGGKCALCGASDWLHVDHALPLAAGGKSAPDNLITLCRACNLKKSKSTTLTQKLQQIAIHRQASIDPQLSVSAEEKRREVEEKRREQAAQLPAPVDKLAPWWKTMESLVAKGRSVGVLAAPGESRDSLYKRVKEALKAKA